MVEGLKKYLAQSTALTLMIFDHLHLNHHLLNISNGVMFLILAESFKKPLDIEELTEKV